MISYLLGVDFVLKQIHTKKTEQEKVSQVCKMFHPHESDSICMCSVELSEKHVSN